MIFFTSTGAVMKDNRKIFKTFAEPETRLSGLQAFLEEILPVFAGEDVTPEQFDYMLQPLYTHDSILFFSRTPLSASDEVVRRSYEARTDYHFRFADQAEEDVLRSIFSTEESGRTLWWMLQAEQITLERNLYDKAWISVKHEPPIPVYAFQRSFPELVFRQEDAESGNVCMRYSFYSIQAHDYSNAKQLMEISLPRSADMETGIQIALKSYCIRHNMQKCDAYSNQKTLCNAVIRDRQVHKGDVYLQFRKLQTFLHSHFPEDTGLVNYQGSCIQVKFRKRLLRIYLFRDEQEKIQFLAGGQWYTTMQDLQAGFADNTILCEKPWFAGIGIQPETQGNFRIGKAKREYLIPRKQKRRKAVRKLPERIE